MTQDTQKGRILVMNAIKVQLYEATKKALDKCASMEADVRFNRGTVEVVVRHGGRIFEVWGGDLVSAVEKMENELNDHYKIGRD